MCVLVIAVICASIMHNSSSYHPLTTGCDVKHSQNFIRQNHSFTKTLGHSQRQFALPPSLLAWQKVSSSCERNVAGMTELCIISRDTENIAMSTAFEKGVCCYLARSWAASIVKATFQIAWGYRPFKQQFGGPDLAPPGVVYSKGSVLVSNARSLSSTSNACMARAAWQALVCIVPTVQCHGTPS